MLFNEFKNKNINVFVAAFGSTYNKIPSQQFIHLPLYNFNYKKSIVGFIWSIFILNRFVKRNKIQIIHSHKRYSDLLSRIVCRLNFISHVSTCHSILNKFNFIPSVFGDYTIAVGKNVYKILLDKFNKKECNVFIVKNNLIELNNDFNTSPKLIKSNKTKFCWIGYLNDNKNINLLLDSFFYLINVLKVNNFICFVKIFDDEVDSFNYQIQQLNLANNIKIVGDEVNSLNLFKEVQFGILTSKTEGGSPPFVILEAAKMKKPYISTNIDDIPDFIHHKENGLLNNFDKEKLAENILLLLKDKSFCVKLGNFAYKSFLNHQNINSTTNDVLKIYNNILNVYQK